jgi:uncharacterized membrane protein YgcG
MMMISRTGKILYNFRFPTLDLNSFVTRVLPLNVLSPDEVSSVFYQIQLRDQAEGDGDPDVLKKPAVSCSFSIIPRINSHARDEMQQAMKRLEGKTVFKKSAPPTCPRYHTLVKFDTPESGFGCDICKQILDAQTTCYGCRKCDWDSCLTCWVARVKVCEDVHAMGPGWAITHVPSGSLPIGFGSSSGGFGSSSGGFGSSSGGFGSSSGGFGGAWPSSLFGSGSSTSHFATPTSSSSFGNAESKMK